MLSKNQQKVIRRLSKKKFRQKSGLFVAEGEKLVYELLACGWKADQIYSINPLENVPHTLLKYSELKKISHLVSASPIIGIFHLPKNNHNNANEPGFSIALDNISDPGNLGTIIRLCDWFGIKNIYCSSNSVDCFNPKVVQSTMGSIARIHCHYVDLMELIENFDFDIYAATFGGKSIYRETFSPNGLLVMGSESHGIGKSLLEKINNQITIPSLSNTTGPESLNVATATAIVLSEIFRP